MRLAIPHRLGKGLSLPLAGLSGIPLHLSDICRPGHTYSPREIPPKELPKQMAVITSRDCDSSLWEWAICAAATLRLLATAW